MTSAHRLNARDLISSAKWVKIACICLAVLACESEPRSPITLQVGPEQIIHFEPKSAFAHYFELPGQEDIMRIVLASYELGCTEYKPPPEGEVFVTVTVRTPAGTKFEVGQFPWEGIRPAVEALDTEEPPPPQKSALPFVRLANEGRSLPVGGYLNLKKVDPVAFGQVEGTFMFRDGSDGEAADTALLGDFSVRICQLQLNSAPAKATE